MVEVRDWLRTVVGARGGDPTQVAAVWELLAVPLRGHPLARIHLATAPPLREPSSGDLGGDLDGGDLDEGLSGAAS
ncbi:hypothetical protein [Nocardioides litoris]|uniref:hypothetical protein n=1 Tax=Nocardioides litoris TaxID=1926648 RepID=UPI001120C839|nr:hypothetical protein [Nocardioides litoris]